MQTTRTLVDKRGSCRSYPTRVRPTPAETNAPTAPGASGAPVARTVASAVRLRAFAVFHERLNLFALAVGQRHEAVGGKRTPGADHAVRSEELDVLPQSRDHADVRLLDVEEQRPRHRIFAGGDRVHRRGEAAQGW